MSSNRDDLLSQLKEEGGQLAARILLLDKALEETREELKASWNRIRDLEDTHTRLSAKVDSLIS